MHSLVGTDETERSNWTRREDTLVLGRDISDIILTPLSLFSLFSLYFKVYYKKKLLYALKNRVE